MLSALSLLYYNITYDYLISLRFDNLTITTVLIKYNMSVNGVGRQDMIQK